MSKEITISYLGLRNFKGIKNFELRPNNSMVNVFGDNRTGKTTLATAFTWLLWGKDLQDRKDYAIKTLDGTGNAVPKLEHEVSCILVVSGTEVSIKRIYKEKWTKRRGEEIAELTGHETDYWWNDVPLKQKEFSQKVDELFGGETIFKILTNPLFFNNTMAWEQRRGILIDIVGEINDNDILQSDSKFSKLIDKLTGKTLDELKAQLKSRKSTIKDKLEAIPGRMDEVERMMPAMVTDEKQLQKDIDELSEQIASIDEQIKDKSKLLEKYYETRSGWVNNINSIKQQIRDIEINAQNKANEENNKNSTKVYEVKKSIATLDREVADLKEQIERNEKDAEQLVIMRDALRASFDDESKKTLEIDDREFACPTCKRPYDAEKASKMEAEMLANFNRKQAEKLEEIRKEGKELNQRIAHKKGSNEALSKNIEEIERKIEMYKEELKTVVDNPSHNVSAENFLSGNTEYSQLKERLVSLENNEPQKPGDGNTSELEADKVSKIKKLNELEQMKGVNQQIERLTNRKDELLNEEKKLVQEQANLEKDEFLIEEFTRAKVDMLEGKVNRLFPSVKFQMFEQQLNGGIRETCNALIDGVPFAAANSAAQVQSGIEIINVLHTHYEIILPIIIDNRESITSIPGTKAQAINLFKDENYKSLTVK